MNTLGKLRELQNIQEISHHIFIECASLCMLKKFKFFHKPGCVAYITRILLSTH